MFRNKTISLNIGKNGLNQNVLDEILTLLKKYETIKIKFLQSSEERQDLDSAINKILSSTNTKLVKKIGFVIVINKK